MKTFCISEAGQQLFIPDDMATAQSSPWDQARATSLVWGTSPLASPKIAKENQEPSSNSAATTRLAPEGQDIMAHRHSEVHKGGIPWGLMLGALGVVFGDIGTSPLYTLKACFAPAHDIAITQTSVLGILSLIIWSLICVITIKYLTFLLRADNRGEGGVLTLMTLTGIGRGSSASRRGMIIFPALFAAALLYGDGMITPAISVLSAVEGLNVVAPSLASYVIPTTLVILFLLFVVQKQGTCKIGYAFGPIILVWYVVIGCLGLHSIVYSPHVLHAFNPIYGINFLLEHAFKAFVILSSVFLAVTGGEALYADMGHFGRFPIRLAWFFVALPALLFSYLGQGALLLNDPATIENPFFLLAPEWFQLPLLCIATAATVTASQAVISGAFSLTRQAVQLGYLPRMAISHTSADEIGQIYVAAVNWALLILTVWLVIEFQSSENLASAYGIAVSGTMIVTSYLFIFAARTHFKWSPVKIALCILPLLFFDTAFFASNLLKTADGGWAPLGLGLIIFTLMTTWRRGREILGARLAENLMPLDTFINSFRGYPRTSGTAIFMTRNTLFTPPALLHNVKHNKVLHERVILMLVQTEEIPIVPSEERFEVEPLSAGFYRLSVHFGYREEPDIPKLLAEVEQRASYLNMNETIFFLGRETILATERPGMAIWRENLFAFMSRNAQSATRYFKLPSDKVVEIGLQVEI